MRVSGEKRTSGCDRHNLAALFRLCGYVNLVVRSFDSSGWTDWDRLGLDRDESGREYKPESLYMEAT